MSFEQPVNSPLTAEMVVARVQPEIFAEQQKMNPQNSAAFQRMFRDRVAVETALAARSRMDRDRDSWSFGEGFYRGGPFRKDDGHRYDRIALTEDLIGDEVAMNEQVNELLAQRNSAGKPVVLVDFGGGLGLSMMRIAARHRTEIERGDLVILVTNLGYMPKVEPDNNGYSGVARSLNASNHSRYEPTHYSPEEISFAQDNQELVTYVDATAAELATKTITPPGKPSMYLDSSVDIIHEANAIMHTHAPDVALAVFGELLSDQGTLYLDAQRANYMHGSQTRSIQVADGRTIDLHARPYEDSRGEALEVGIQLLQTKHGMQRAFRDLSYSLFTKPHAPDFNAIAARLR